MTKTKHPPKSPQLPSKEKPLDVKLPPDPEDPIIPDEDPDIILDEDLTETPPYELPPPGEGP